MCVEVCSVVEEIRLFSCSGKGSFLSDFWPIRRNNAGGNM